MILGILQDSARAKVAQKCKSQMGILLRHRQGDYENSCSTRFHSYLSFLVRTLIFDVGQIQTRLFGYRACIWQLLGPIVLISLSRAF